METVLHNIPFNTASSSKNEPDIIDIFFLLPLS